MIEGVASGFIAVVIVWAAAHFLGNVAVSAKQPRLLGELVGGLLLGPTCLGYLAPGFKATLFDGSPDAVSFRYWVQRLGLAALMFLAGVETRNLLRRADWAITTSLVVSGLLLPFGAALVIVKFIDLTPLMGPAGSVSAAVLVIACAAAVTSIPIISRIMLDLGILKTRFARIVLSVALIDDLILYTAISVALGIAGAVTVVAGLPKALGVTTSFVPLYYSTATIALLLLAAAVAPPLGRLLLRWRRLRSGMPVASAIVCVSLVLLSMACAAQLAIDGAICAFAAGIAMGRIEATENMPEASAGFRRFALAALIPVYFGGVGLSLDLVHDLQPSFAIGFIAIATAVKVIGVYIGATVVGQPSRRAANLAVALNARGGPGIALATIALNAGIASRGLYTSMVLLALVTSLVAAAWLRAAVANDSEELLPR